MAPPAKRTTTKLIVATISQALRRSEVESAMYSPLTTIRATPPRPTLPAIAYSARSARTWSTVRAARTPMRAKSQPQTPARPTITPTRCTNSAKVYRLMDHPLLSLMPSLTHRTKDALRLSRSVPVVTLDELTALLVLPLPGHVATHAIRRRTSAHRRSPAAAAGAAGAADSALCAMRYALCAMPARCGPAAYTVASMPSDSG